MRLKRSELRHVLNPKHTYISWAVFYAIMIITGFSGLYVLADHIKTHSVPIGKIQISTPYSKYLLGETISFAITNQYNTTVYVTNKCPIEPLAVYYKVNGNWSRVHADAPKKSCTNQERQVGIPANSQVIVSLAPWGALFSKAGQYRLVEQVSDYGSLPYVDFEIVEAPVVKTATNASSTPISSLATQSTSTPSTSVENSQKTSAQPSATSQQTTSSPPAPSPPPAQPATIPSKTVVVHVTSAGNYDVTSLSLNSGDSIQFVYSPPYSSEVQTRFSAVAPTAATYGSVTLDIEYKTRTKLFSTPGTWTYKAADKSGNTGTLTIK